jgi:23S rRNA pseudouridine2605 synthase
VDCDVKVDGKRISQAGKKLYKFYKPRSVITTLSDPEKRRCVGDYTEELPVRVYPIGRLDYDVSGLLLLTNDGELTEKLLHPRYGVEREYLARVKGVVGDGDFKPLMTGVLSQGEKLKAKSVSVARKSKIAIRLLGEVKENETILKVIVSEGAKHFVKRLLTGGGYDIIKLSRVRFGAYDLGNMKPGEIRELEL